MDEKTLAGYQAALNITEVEPGEPIEGLIVMPQKVDATDGTGYYSNDAASTQKELASLGYKTSFYTDKKAAIYLNSAEAYTLVEFLVGFFVYGMGSAAAWDGIKALVRLKASKRVNPVVRAKIYIVSNSNNSKSWQEYDLNGSVDDAIKMIDAIRKQHEDDQSIREKEIQ